MQKENHDIVLAIVSSSALILFLNLVTFLVILNSVKKKKELMLANEKQAAIFQEQLLHAQLEMQEHTFRIVSQEIHDNVGQILSLTKLNLNIITARNKGDDAIRHIKELVGEAISELRDLSQGYYADKLSREGLVNAIKHLAEQHKRTGLFQVSFHTDFDQVTLDKSSVIFLYRMVQEALNNIVKHAVATEVKVGVYERGNKIQIIIEDNGKGFDSKLPGFKQGIGLSSITQRATMIGAQSIISSTPGSGTMITLAFNAAS